MGNNNSSDMTYLKTAIEKGKGKVRSDALAALFNLSEKEANRVPMAAAQLGLLPLLVNVVVTNTACKH